MDRTGWIVVILCVIGMVLYYPYMMRDARRPAPPGVEGAPGAPGPAEEIKKPETAAEQAVAKPPGISQAPEVEEKIVEISTQAVRFKLTNRGGGIREAELLDHAATLASEGKIRLNEYGPFPAGVIGDGNGEFEADDFEMVRATSREVVFEATSADSIKVTKRYFLEEGADGYLINLEMTFENRGSEPYQGDGLLLYLGSVAPLHPQEWPQQTGFFWFDGQNMRFRDVNYFGAKRFIVQWREGRESFKEQVPLLDWAGVMDQFYTIVARNRNPAPGAMWASRFPVHLNGYADMNQNSTKITYAIEGAFGIPQLRLGPGMATGFSWEIYMGPKEFQRLNALGYSRDEIMNYGDFPVIGRVVAPVSRILVRTLVFLEGKVGNFGVAILIITFCIRLLIWPLHAKSTRTMKRMASLAPKMSELKEKYPDDPQKLNQEMMQLYRDYGVNPFGGCLPALLQLPIFLGFYRMLQSAVELRHQGFLWVDDLSMPDTLFEIPVMGGIPFNLLPLLMGGTMLIQMWVAPKSGDKMQQRIFMFMPLIFLFICYNFASALALYWTAQNIFSIGQTWYMGRQPEPELKKKPKSRTAGLLEQARERTRVAGQGPAQTESKAQKKKRRK